MPTNIAIGATANAAPSTVLQRAWAALMGAWSRQRNRLAVLDLDERMLRDIGFEVRRRGATAPLGWAVEPHPMMGGPLFLGR